MRTALLALSLASASLSVVACGHDAPPATTTTANALDGGTGVTGAAVATDAGAANGGSASADASAFGAVGGVVVDTPAPDFNLVDQDGKKLALADLKGHPVVLYFYPKDETPGCTKEACAFRDAWDGLAKTGVVLIGVSADSDESHRAFAKNHKLPFHLVSDADGKLAAEYQVPFKGYTSRQSFLIGSDGMVRRIYRTVNVETHAQDLAAALKQTGT